MKAFCLFSLTLVLPFHLFATCFLQVKTFGDLDREWVEESALTLVSNYLKKVEVYPADGVKDGECVLRLKAKKSGKNQTIILNYSSKGGVGVSSLVDDEGLQQALLRSIYRINPRVKKRICSDYQRLLKSDCESRKNEAAQVTQKRPVEKESAKPAKDEEENPDLGAFGRWYQSLDDGRQQNRFQLQIDPGIVAGGVKLLVGYHLTREIYIGVVGSNPALFKNIASDDEEDAEEDRYRFDQPGQLDSTTDLGTYHFVEVRYTPFTLGFYANIGYGWASETSVSFDFDKRERTIGDNEYDTALFIKQTFLSSAILVYGLGFNHVTESGFSYNFGIQLANYSKDKVLVDVAATTEGVQVSEEDILLEEEKIRSNNLVAAFAQASIGVNF